MDCERVRDRLSDFHDGSLAGEDLRGVADHLQECRECKAESEGLKETVALLRNLPPGKAPPQLMKGVMARIAATEPRGVPLWKKLFLPAHVKIPLEAAAAVLLFLLVFGIQRDRPMVTPFAPPAPRTEEAAPAPQAAPGSGPVAPAVRRKAGQAGRAASPSRKPPVAEREDAGRPTPPPAVPEVRPTPPPALPTVPAQRASTDGGSIGQALPAASAEEKSKDIRIFGAPPSRLLRPVPFGRDVTMHVSPEVRPGLEERIVETAIRLGGSLPRPPEPSAAFSEKTSPGDGIVRVHLPAASAEPFLDALRTMGTIPPEGAPAAIDLPAGPSEGIVAYTVRIRVR